MAFQVKDFLSITASMVNHIRGATKKLTDFNVGSVNRSMLEAVSVEVDELYQQTLNGLRDAIPVATYRSFNFNKLPAIPAYVSVTFTVSPVSASAITIPAGTIIRVPNAVVGYTTDSELIIAAGVASGDVRVTADQIGVIGNALAGSIVSMDVLITDVTVSNPAAAINGRDEETNEEQKSRFNDYIKSLSRGPVGALEYGARTATIKNSNGDIVEQVTKSNIVEPYTTDTAQPLGYIDCYIYNGAGNTSAALQVETQKIIDGYYDLNGDPVMGWKASGIVCVVKLVAEQPQNVTGILTVAPGYDSLAIAAELGTQITTYIQGLDIDNTLILNELISLAMSIDGVTNIAYSAPVADVVPASNVKIIPGAITIS